MRIIIDHKKAFNKVNPDILLSKFYNYDIKKLKLLNSVYEINWQNLPILFSQLFHFICSSTSNKANYSWAFVFDA